MRQPCDGRGKTNCKQRARLAGGEVNCSSHDGFIRFRFSWEARERDALFAFGGMFAEDNRDPYIHPSGLGSLNELLPAAN